jgi:hypothetical protein
MAQSNCEITGCDNSATHLTTTETKFIEICADHYNEKYKK